MSVQTAIPPFTIGAALTHIAIGNATIRVQIPETSNGAAKMRAVAVVPSGCALRVLYLEDGRFGDTQAVKIAI